MTYTCEIHELSRRWLRIRVSCEATPSRRYWLSWDGISVRESAHTRAMRERAPEALSELLRWLGERWTRELMAAAIDALGKP